LGGGTRLAAQRKSIFSMVSSCRSPSSAPCETRTLTARSANRSSTTRLRGVIA